MVIKYYLKKKKTLKQTTYDMSNTTIEGKKTHFSIFVNSTLKNLISIRYVIKFF